MGRLTFPSFPTFLLLVLLAVPACRGPRQNVGPAPAEADGFSLILNSHHLLDVNIFVLHDGQADRVAMVPSSSSRAIVLPRWMLGQSNTIRLIAEPIGDDSRYMTDMLSVQPGQIIEFNVEGSLDRSSYTIQ
jgi:hypothetical protein